MSGMVIGRAFPVPLGVHTLGISAEQDDRGRLAIHVRQYRPDGSQDRELLRLRPTTAGDLANAIHQALCLAGVRR